MAVLLDYRGAPLAPDSCVVAYSGGGLFRVLGLVRLDGPYREYLPDYHWHGPSSCVRVFAAEFWE